MEKAHWKNCLQRERVQHNWRQSDLAEQLDISISTVQRWEKGSQKPGPYYRLKLAALFGKSPEDLGFGVPSPSQPISTQEQTIPEEATREVSMRTDLALWNIPHRRNPHFTGREELLAQLWQRLHPPTQEEPRVPHRAALTQAITGLGGIGKTQIAVEYAYRAREQGRYTHILWVSAANEETLFTSFVALAELLPDFAARGETDQRKLITAVKRWMEDCPQPWLLIVDNADELSLVQSALPQQGLGSLLLTTRAHAVGALATSLEVETMGLVEGTQFLLQRTQRSSASEEACDEAMNIVIALDGFPLALDQAGAYIEETGCSFADYLQLYQTHRLALLARRGQQTCNYPHSVATTWSLSFQKVEQICPAAAELLHLCTFLAPDHIPEELISEGAAHWPPALQHAAADGFTFNRLVEALLAFSLVKRQAKDHLLSIHRLVQTVQKETMGLEEQRQWAERVVRAVHAIFPPDPTDKVATWPQCLRYLEQAQACYALIQQYLLVLPEAADLLDSTATYLREHASYSLAEPLYQQALHIREQHLGPEHPLIASSLYHLANLCSEQCRHEQAECLFLQALQIREQTLGQEHHEVATSLSGLAGLYWKQGKYQQAEPLYQRALHIREQQLGAMHPSVAASLSNLALLYTWQGTYEKAEPFCQRALFIYEQQLGEMHPRVAYPLNNLANLYLMQGRYTEAEPLYQRALRIREHLLGETHPIVATSLNNLAELFSRQEKYTEAEPLYQRALRIWEKQLGPDHPQVAHALAGLANLYRMQRNYGEAQSFYERALHVREQFAPIHPDIAEALHGMALVREAQGAYQEAESLYQRALAIREHVYGLHHPKTIETRERLASASAAALKQTEEAVA